MIKSPRKSFDLTRAFEYMKSVDSLYLTYNLELKKEAWLNETLPQNIEAI